MTETTAQGVLGSAIKERLPARRRRTRRRARAPRRPAAPATSCRRLAQLDRHLAAIDTEIGKRLAEDERLARRTEILTSIPGVSRVTAAGLLTQMPELGGLDAKAVASLAGLAPVTRQSGAWQGRSFIQGGRARARRLLYMPALAAICYNPDLRAKYGQLVAQGKPRKVAVVAVMRKLLVLANVLLGEDRCWLPERPGRGSANSAGSAPLVTARTVPCVLRPQDWPDSEQQETKRSARPVPASRARDAGSRARTPAKEQQHSLTDRPCTTFDRSSRAAISSGGPVDQGHHGDRLHERGLGVRRRTGSRAGGMDRTVSLMMTSRSRGNRRRCEVGSRGANIWSATCTSVRVARRASSTRVRRVKRSRVRRRVDLDPRLAGSPSAAAAGESRQRDLRALREPRQQVLELRQLHLELASRVVACCAKMSRMSCVRSMREGELADQTANTPGNHWLTPTHVGGWLFHTQESASGFTVKEIPFNPILTLASADRGVRPRRAHLAPAHPPAITASSGRARLGRTQRPLVRAAATRVGALGAALPGSWSSGRGHRSFAHAFTTGIGAGSRHAIMRLLSAGDPRTTT